ncbi:DUF5134 domain-containing protein [Streptomyces sp. NPDC059224]|uniref:DUF5134 domain-containing protein n=1 Tax=Streptomyces sp. NPDC059224 TaxID=3346775 RepID=UPI0036CDEC3C
MFVAVSRTDTYPWQALDEDSDILETLVHRHRTRPTPGALTDLLDQHRPAQEKGKDIAVAALHWLLTVCFAAVAGRAAWRAGAAPDGGAPAGDPALERVAHALHALMAVAMAVMTWPWGMSVPVTPQVAFFSLAAIWFLAAACFVRSSTAPLSYRLLHAAPHALTMAATAWMAHTMRTGPSVGGGESGSSMVEMPGMQMSAPGSTAATTLTGSDSSLTIIVAVVALALALRWLTPGFNLARNKPAVRTPHTPMPTAPHGLSYHDLMALGMAVMLIVIA